jgi:ABC-2 type transport system permease protein
MSDTAPVTTSGRKPGLAALGASYRLGLSTVLTRGRIIGGIALVVLVLVQFSAFSGGDLEGSGIDVTVLFVSLVIGVLIPVFTVSTATTVLGSSIADNTLVYLWLRPVARWKLALGHIGAALTINVPVALLVALAGTIGLVNATGAELTSGEGLELVLSGAIAGLAGGLAYTPLLVALGGRYKRASTFAYVYIFLVEQLFARNSTGISRLAVQTYVRSTFYGIADSDISADVGEVVSPRAAWLAIGLLFVLGTALTALVLKRTDVA